VSILSYHIDPTIYKDYGLPKIYDVIFYGSTTKYVYPFRFRIKTLLKKSHLKVLIIEQSSKYNINNCGIGLAKKINQSWLGVATTSNFDYLVGKYFEISGCNTCLVGNMNEQGKSIWGNNYVNIDQSMSDEQIISVIRNALEDKQGLSAMSTRMYQLMHTNYTTQQHKSKLYELVKSLK
jgi:hypothetical protein